MERVSLDGMWELIERPLDDLADAFGAVREAATDVTVQVPGDVSDALVKAGRMPEPLAGTNFRQFGWIEERSWWFRRTIDVPAAWSDAAGVELSLDGLDVHADVWLNGTHLGHHRTAFRPFSKEVRGIVTCGEPNELVVRLTTGAERARAYEPFDLIDCVPTEAGRGYPERGMKERVYLRKPAYTWGWDWAPHLATCGITGSCSLRAHRTTEIGDVSLRTRLDGAAAVVTATVEVERRTLIDSARGDVRVTLTDADGASHDAVARDVLIRSGTTHVDLEIEIPDARLWWPNGSGEAHRYEATSSVTVGGETVAGEPFRYGVRTVELDTRPGRFAFVINGVPTFIKGGNWIPSDSLYGRITPEKVTHLVEEAAEANFNVLRIWGGGRFEQDAFYDACDRCGIMLWHDFMAACAPTPVGEQWIAREFELEAECQIRRLRNRPCMMLWCGNNEVSACLEGRGGDDPAWYVFHRMLPSKVRLLAPHIPYWPTSPYGGDRTGSSTEGDDHHWVVMRRESEYWSAPEYWDEPGRSIFNSEYGYGGPCCIESTREYMGSDEPDLFSETGRQHTNSFYDIPRVNFSIKEHYRDPEGLPLSEYILFGGLCQGLNLGYSLESLRANDNTMGGIFWMYDDAWGENGWTIVDYYLRRKISYYNVKRCLAPRRLVLRPGGKAFGGSDGEVVLVAINETPEALSGTVKLGYVSYDGTVSQLRDVELDVAPRSKVLVATVSAPSAEERDAGTIVALPQGVAGLDSASWRHRKFRETGIAEVDVEIRGAEVDGDDLVVKVGSACYAHAVHLQIGGEYRLSDHYFDLAPGEEREVRIHNGADLDVGRLEAKSVGSGS